MSSLLHEWSLHLLALLCAHELKWLRSIVQQGWLTFSVAIHCNNDMHCY